MWSDFGLIFQKTGSSKKVWTLPEESVKAFAARARVIASNCELEKNCSCGRAVNYTEETVYNVVLAGLRDRDLQERCTAQALLKNIKDISSLVSYCSAEEGGKQAVPGMVGGIRSGYKKLQNTVKTEGSGRPGAQDGRRR